MSTLQSAIPAVLVEAFAETPCSGNGAAVVLLPQPQSDGWMQGVARSLNQSETAFLLKGADGWMLRWFTPSCEVALCGHATLAALLALRHWGRINAGGSLTFATRSGPLPVALSDGLGQITLPAPPLQPSLAPPSLQRLVLQPLGVRAAEGFWRSALGYSVLLLPPEADLPRLSLAAGSLEPSEASGLVLMQACDGAESPAPCVAGRPAQYRLRFFAPGLGIPEDPVTGSAHALVAPFWLQRLAMPSVVGWQCSARPGGMICEMASSGMIRLSGTGFLLWCGSLQIQPEPGAAAAQRWGELCKAG